MTAATAQDALNLIPTRGNLPWLKDRTILLVQRGSRAYGTHRLDSDFDYGGICITPRYIRDGFLHQFEQAEFKPVLGESTFDGSIFSLQKFFKLAASATPNALELLWTEDRLLCTKAGQMLVAHRKLFLSQKVLHTFRGYAMAQLRRVRSHRRWLLEPPPGPPDRAAYGLPPRTAIPADQLDAAQSCIQKKMDSWEIDFGAMEKADVIYIQEQIKKHLAEMSVGVEEKAIAAGRLLGYEDNFLLYLDRERKYKQAKTEWKQYQTWKSERNPARAKMEATFGYDGKHALHLVRLMRMCREILTSGIVNVFRQDAEELKGLLVGSWTFDALMSWAEAQDRELPILAKESPLPKEPNRRELDNLCIRIQHDTLDAWDTQEF